MSDIRKATNKDIEQLFNWFYNPVVFFLCDPSLKYPFHLDDWLKLFNSRNLFVIKNNNFIVGTIAVIKNKTQQEFSHLYIDKLYRGNGFAKELIQYVLKNNQLTVVKLLEKQRELINLFTGFGFIKTNIKESFNFESQSEVFDLYHRSQS